jgi:beta-lactamase regulating signal transducer with metallopeptidase domain
MLTASKTQNVTFLTALVAMIYAFGQAYADFTRNLAMRLLPKRMQRTRRLGIGILGTVIMIGVAAISLMLIIIVVAQVDANAPTITGQANSTYESATTQIYNALNLAPIIMIVLIAGAVLGVLIVFGKV